ncbi:hypothetical protein ABMA46_19795 [Mesorhizobium sp. CN5-321]|uniref:hypothetical protein n=1 Tax=Mesorhizobium hunchu TaxID=3157708 RepID=UPI0032B76739
MDSQAEWRPGSFTKNFSWGARSRGLYNLYEAIRVGFNNELRDTPRFLFRNRIEALGRPDFIPINFFLFNRVIDGVDTIIVDELVYQALTFSHSNRFDRLAIFAFNFSFVGSWKGSKPYQSRPALWAHHYISDRFGPVHRWNSTKITADDIQNFVQSDPRYRAEGARKLSTNLNYLYGQVDLGFLASKKVDRWWVDALFLALDRITATRSSTSQFNSEERLHSYLLASDFFGVSGERSIAKDLASKHLVDLYRYCGGIKRFDDDAVRARTATFFQDIENYAVNNPNPIAAVHKTNLSIFKTLPRVCAMLARVAGFETFDIEDLENLDTSALARQNIDRALENLRKKGISPKISSEELMKIIRES